MTSTIAHRVGATLTMIGVLMPPASTSSFAQQPAAQQQQQQPPAAQPRQQPFPPEVAAANEAFGKQDWATAVERYREAIAKGYEYPFVQMRTGYALHVQGKYAEALPYHLKAANAQQKALRVDGLYNAACAYALTGNKDKALEFLTKAVDAGFLDQSQIEGDSDMDSLRDNDQFKQIVADIGVEPTLFQWMDFFVGDWEQFDSESAGEVLDHLTITRPLDGSLALLTTSRNVGGGQWTGLIWPDSDERLWRWTSADGTGTTQAFVGRRTDIGGMLFEGRDFSPAGPNAHARLMYTPGNDGRVLEKVDVSTDGGKTWRTHHEAWYTKKAAAPDPAPSP